ncbi:MAG: hypothetical protein PVH61_06125 [Candidatus Aminicenantes bacterium]|jgi:hypothetical protein
MKRFNYVILGSVCLLMLFSLLSLSLWSDEGECSCFEDDKIENACASPEEFLFDEVIQAKCDYNACAATITVWCQDMDDQGAVYKRVVSSWKICADCESGGGQN